MRRSASPLRFHSDRSAGNGKDEWATAYLAGVAVVVFALNEHFHNKSGQVVLIVLGGGFSYSLAHLCTFTGSFG
jgi:hypothetical protein